MLNWRFVWKFTYVCKLICMMQRSRKTVKSLEFLFRLSAFHHCRNGSFFSAYRTKMQYQPSDLLKRRLFIFKWLR